jgi:hypothetical protein
MRARIDAADWRLVADDVRAGKFETSVLADQARSDRAAAHAGKLARGSPDVMEVRSRRVREGCQGRWLIRIEPFVSASPAEKLAGTFNATLMVRGDQLAVEGAERIGAKGTAMTASLGFCSEEAAETETGCSWGLECHRSLGLIQGLLTIKQGDQRLYYEFLGAPANLPGVDRFLAPAPPATRPATQPAPIGRSTYYYLKYDAPAEWEFASTRTRIDFTKPGLPAKKRYAVGVGMPFDGKLQMPGFFQDIAKDYGLTGSEVKPQITESPKGHRIAYAVIVRKPDERRGEQYAALAVLERDGRTQPVFVVTNDAELWKANKAWMDGFFDGLEFDLDRLAETKAYQERLDRLTKKPNRRPEVKRSR